MDWIKLQKNIEQELHMHILPFWLENMKDSDGGLFGQISNKNVVTPTAPKGLVMVSRFLWTYSEAFRTSKKEKYKRFADDLKDYLLSIFQDKKNGGFYWTVDSRGNKKDCKKVLYGQAFALYALSTYQQINPSKENSTLCSQLFSLLEKYGKDEQYGGYFEAMAEDWSYNGRNNLGADDLPCDKSMNTNLHMLEAYTRYYWESGRDDVKKSLKALIEIIITKIYNSSTGHQKLYFTTDWTSLGNIESYGHDVETSWLIWEALEILDDPELQQKYREIVLMMLQTSSKKATAPDGSLYNESKNGHLDKVRIWWVQAEYAVSLMNGWMMTGKEEYKEKLFKLWDYIEEKQKDKTYGEWFWGIEDNGSVQEQDKGGMWKTPYHNGRACIELIHRINKIKESTNV